VVVCGGVCHARRRGGAELGGCVEVSVAGIPYEVAGELLAACFSEDGAA